MLLIYNRDMRIFTIHIEDKISRAEAKKIAKNLGWRTGEKELIVPVFTNEAVDIPRVTVENNKVYIECSFTREPAYYPEIKRELKEHYRKVTGRG